MCACMYVCVCVCVCVCECDCGHTMCMCLCVCVCVHMGESGHVRAWLCNGVCEYVRVSKNVTHVELVNTIHFKNRGEAAYYYLYYYNYTAIVYCTVDSNGE